MSHKRCSACGGYRASHAGGLFCQSCGILERSNIVGPTLQAETIKKLQGQVDGEARDAEHRAELDAARATIEQLGKDGAALATENERLKGELAEANARADALESLIDTERQVRKEAENALFFVRKELAETKRQRHRSAGTAEDRCDKRCMEPRYMHDRPYDCGHPFIDAAPPPAESTPVQPDQAHETNYGREAQLPSPNTDGRIGTKARDTSDAEGKAKVAGESPAAPSIHVHGTDAQPAPPDDIRERLDAFERKLAQLQSGLAALEAKGEPGTHAFEPYPTIDGGVLCDGCGKPDGPPHHAKGAKP